MAQTGPACNRKLSHTGAFQDAVLAERAAVAGTEALLGDRVPRMEDGGDRRTSARCPSYGATYTAQPRVIANEPQHVCLDG